MIKPEYARNVEACLKQKEFSQMLCMYFDCANDLDIAFGYTAYVTAQPDLIKAFLTLFQQEPEMAKCATVALEALAMIENMRNNQ